MYVEAEEEMMMMMLLLMMTMLVDGPTLHPARASDQLRLADSGPPSSYGVDFGERKLIELGWVSS